MDILLYLIESFIFIFVVQIVFFAFAYFFKTDKVTDLSYSLTFILLALYLLVKNAVYSPDHVILTALILIWGLRLMFYLFIRILKIKTDKRFDGVREDFGKFAVFWTGQAITIFIIMIPAIIVLASGAKTVNNLMLAGVVVWIVGFVIESFADAQKFSFKNDLSNKGKFIKSGLWKYSRHPNYFGEMTVWWGIFIFSLPYLGGFTYLAVTGPLFITFILLFVSGIPPLEKKYDSIYSKDSKYQEYKKTTSILIPWVSL